MRKIELFFFYIGESRRNQNQFNSNSKPNPTRRNYTPPILIRMECADENKTKKGGSA